ncbi:Hsp20/alpha crystallin family protein [Methanobacterium alcaliphilum]|uniref:Hsp20/alpha crystallin family protein n=1 Tax=Methanobacterium alcaliphilum TaxID=392018 RepID=UPI00200A188E|nr:Hsp20/alpha crystallin family protein [Methanobacterium alcaliphilum]MCK9150648.1 Hsp20/alpha crystallin family protein [Methanobacterium alcaliphilum]
MKHKQHASEMKCHLKEAFNESANKINELRCGIEESIFNHDLLPGKMINETPDSLIIKIVIPGVKKEDIKVDLSESELYLEAEIETEHILKGRVISLSDKKTAHFRRKISLPEKVIPEKSKARLKNGILKIEVVKLEKSKFKEVKIE